MKFARVGVVRMGLARVSDVLARPALASVVRLGLARFDAFPMKLARVGAFPMKLAGFSAFRIRLAVVGALRMRLAGTPGTVCGLGPGGQHGAARNAQGLTAEDGRAQQRATGDEADEDREQDRRQRRRAWATRARNTVRAPDRPASPRPHPPSSCLSGLYVRPWANPGRGGPGGGRAVQASMRPARIA
ncbi:hypothetical protein WJM95_32165 [Streptomyces sp. f51]|uniref:hypothetical protein n=1 Tax=Streptomyces sp. f51 TaxID=1827742 RepID=UPI0030D3B743